MKIYHGSISIIKQPIFGYGSPYNDYGLGFYCTEEIEKAKEWAVDYELDGYSNCYELDISNLRILNLNEKPYTTLHWLALLLQNRIFKSKSLLVEEAKEYILKHFSIDCSKYDVIIGYRADDSYFSFARDFLQGTISYRQLNVALKLGNLGQQVVLKSKKAFEAIRFINAEIVYASEWFFKKRRREEKARNEYFNSTKMKREKGDIYINQIIDENMEANDERLQ
ncbi:MAG: DUF3990 domain-containing protein [Bacilli bacterium]|nr:DUF3990 domain-containing protein [Bacilli bacterium]